MERDEGPRVIKRYKNRKLYDMTDSCYITHEEIAALVESGEEVRIIDNSTKEDLTSATLTQILFDQQRRNEKTLPMDTLKSFIQQGGEFIQRRIALRGRPGQDKELPEPPPLPPIQEEGAPGAVPAARAKATDALREWVTGTQQAYESIQKNVEDRWNVVSRYLGQFDVNHRRIVELEHRVETLEARLAALEGATLKGAAPKDATPKGATPESGDT